MMRPVTLFVLSLALISCERGSPAVETSSTPQTRIETATETETATTVAPVTSPSTSNTPQAGNATTQPGSDASQAANDPSQHQRLHGTWVAQDVDSKLGEVKIQLTFKEEGPVRILAWSELPFVGQVRNKQGPYEVHGNTISSDAIRGGTSVNYRFDGGDLIIEYKDGKTVRFNRQT